ncbi:DddA-like double-stranded DNA deaminase toxin [Kitasatospora cineracea]|uniref:DddA-like double-stranded DNA deaminase toxin n=1 Tax=Kitasatospora cineracea TaxID=88074 RepID=UPI0034259ED8
MQNQPTRGYVLETGAKGERQATRALVSGNEATKAAINKYIMEDLGYAAEYNSRGIVSITANVETKPAWEMRNEGIREMEIVINRSVCEGADADKFLQIGCLNVVPLLLPKGYQLTVWYLGEKGGRKPGEDSYGAQGTRKVEKMKPGRRPAANPEITIGCRMEKTEVRQCE